MPNSAASHLDEDRMHRRRTTRYAAADAQNDDGTHLLETAQTTRYAADTQKDDGKR